MTSPPTPVLDRCKQLFRVCVEQGKKPVRFEMAASAREQLWYEIGKVMIPESTAPYDPGARLVVYNVPCVVSPNENIGNVISLVFSEDPR